MEEGGLAGVVGEGGLGGGGGGGARRRRRWRRAAYARAGPDDSKLKQRALPSTDMAGPPM